MTTAELRDRLRAGPPAVEADLRSFTARADQEGLIDVAWTSYDAPTGPLVVAATEAGLVHLAFDQPDAVVHHLADRLSPRVLEAPARLDPVRTQLDEYFDGRRRSFDLHLDWALSTGFRRRVLAELAQVTYGEVVTYRTLAERSGSPKASRAVGSAMATNPIPIVVPCHRVIRTGGALGGYGGGLEMKRHLLALEGVTLPMV